MANKLRSVGKPYPGYRVAALREDGTVAEPGETGELAIYPNDAHNHPNPAYPVRIWRAVAAQAQPDAQGWWRSGELVYIDHEGYIWHTGGRNRPPLKTRPTQAKSLSTE